jgi:hypothetical protein
VSQLRKAVSPPGVVTGDLGPLFGALASRSDGRSSDPGPRPTTPTGSDPSPEGARRAPGDGAVAFGRRKSVDPHREAEDGSRNEIGRTESKPGFQVRSYRL